MKAKEITKKCIWLALVIFASFLIIQAGQDVTKNIWTEGDPVFHDYEALFWEVLKEIVPVLPVWLLSLLGFIRSFLGENWFAFAEKIPVRETKILLALSAILLVDVTAAGAVYSEYTMDSVRGKYVMERRLEGLQAVLAWVLFYGIVLYIEQWCLRSKYCRKDIRKRQAWVIMTIFLSCLIVFYLGCVGLWYIPLDRVDCPNALEDYYLWWSSLYSAVFVLPFWFFSARKTVRVFKNNTQWLALTTIIPKTITALMAFAAAGFMVQQVRQSSDWNEWAKHADLPEYGEAAAMAHMFQAMMWGLVLFYMICLLAKQIRTAYRARREQKSEKTT